MAFKEIRGNANPAFVHSSDPGGSDLFPEDLSEMLLKGFLILAGPSQPPSPTLKIKEMFQRIFWKHFLI